MFRNAVIALAILLASVGAASAVTIDHTDVDGVASLPQSTMDLIGRQKWYFTHASVGENMLGGMNALHSANAAHYQLVIVADDGAPPASTAAGTVYHYSRGNPGWSEKFNIFNTAVGAGWRSPKVDVAMDKLCYIDQSANAATYVNMMSALETQYPATVFVYATMPLTYNEDSANILRNQYNDAVRDYCEANGKLLFDIADIESHDPTGNAVAFTSGINTYQKLYSGYTSDGGHLNAVGAERVAKGWYAVAAAIAVPEPGAILMLLTGGAMLLGAGLARGKGRHAVGR